MITCFCDDTRKSFRGADARVSLNTRVRVLVKLLPEVVMNFS